MATEDDSKEQECSAAAVAALIPYRAFSVALSLRRRLALINSLSTPHTHLHHLLGTHLDYTQRAKGDCGLILSEGTLISAQGTGELPSFFLPTDWPTAQLRFWI
jgi:hypothetical protein